MSVKDAIAELIAKMNKEPNAIEGLHALYQFNITGEEEGSYQIKFENQTVALVDEQSVQPNCLLQLSEKNLLKLLQGDLNAQMAFFSGKLKIKGDIGLALKLNSVLQAYK